MKWRETENIGMIGCIEINDNVVCASYRLTKLCDNLEQEIIYRNHEC